jgi:hypothetical protein
MLVDVEVKNENDAPAPPEKQPRVRKRLPVINKDFKLEKNNWHRLRRIIHVL